MNETVNDLHDEKHGGKILKFSKFISCLGIIAAFLLSDHEVVVFDL